MHHVVSCSCQATPRIPTGKSTLASVLRSFCPLPLPAKVRTSVPYWPHNRPLTVANFCAPASSWPSQPCSTTSKPLYTSSSFSFFVGELTACVFSVSSFLYHRSGSIHSLSRSATRAFIL